VHVCWAVSERNFNVGLPDTYTFDKPIDAYFCFLDTNRNKTSTRTQVNTLLAANADIGVRDKEGNTPLHLLFLKKRALLPESGTLVESTNMLLEEDYASGGERSSKHYKLSALKETANN